MKFTIDASVAARWFISGEEYEMQALNIRETLNALWKTVRRRLLSTEDVITLCDKFIRLAPKILSFDTEDFKNIKKWL
ncbi:MAG: hypothetical protein ACUVTD_07725 [Nitrososphaerales archaeon]